MSPPAGRPEGDRPTPNAPTTGAAAPTLADLAVGERGTVAQLVGAGVTVQRLAEMGLTPGTAVTVIRFAPLGDPVEVRVRGYALSLRKADARCVQLAGAGGAAPSGARAP